MPRTVSLKGARGDLSVAPSHSPIPHARDSAPWADCTQGWNPDFGTLFADEPHAGEVGLWFDRNRKWFACRKAADVGAETVLQGRRFDVVRLAELQSQSPEQLNAAVVRAERSEAA